MFEGISEWIIEMLKIQCQRWVINYGNKQQFRPSTSPEIKVKSGELYKQSAKNLAKQDKHQTIQLSGKKHIIQTLTQTYGIVEVYTYMLSGSE